jgi:ribonuclease HII
MNDLYDFDIRFKKENNIDFLIGVDEAGRGPLAGPVVVGAVILNLKLIIEGINDSKKLTEAKRIKLFKEIKELAVEKRVIAVGEKSIDSINILRATFSGMLQCVEEWVSRKNSFVIVDGNVPIPKIDKRQQLPLVKGDAKSASVAAASILAKVTRDQMMKAYALKYPQYQFEKHKGYGTKVHIELIKKHGLCDIHRRSFCHSFVNEALVDDQDLDLVHIL